MKAFLVAQSIPVNTVYHAVKTDCVFVQLKESRNAFTPQLVANIKKAMATIVLRTYRILRKKGYSHRGKQIKEQLERLYVR